MFPVLFQVFQQQFRNKSAAGQKYSDVFLLPVSICIIAAEYALKRGDDSLHGSIHQTASKNRPASGTVL